MPICLSFFQFLSTLFMPKMLINNDHVYQRLTKMLRDGATQNKEIDWKSTVSWSAESFSLGWEKTANRWKVEWLPEEWEKILGRLWNAKGNDNMKVFGWKALMGALPVGKKAAIKGIGSEVCKGEMPGLKWCIIYFGISLAFPSLEKPYASEFLRSGESKSQRCNY